MLVLDYYWGRRRMLSGREVAAIRRQRGWSQQYVANRSGVNKAYISEYESGVRENLPDKMRRSLEEMLLADPAGKAGARIALIDGRQRLILRDKDDNEFTPSTASVQWEEGDTTYTMYLGEVGKD